MSLPKKLSEESRESSDSFENACVVCFKNFDIFSIGECDHPVCYECSTRMRVLCQQNECPICRQGLSKVIFTTEKRSYRELEASNRSEYYNKKYKICFADQQIQKAFYDLLDHPCSKCNLPPFRSFDTLKDHVRKEHEMFFCDICTEHLKIFSFERKCYTRHELGLHRRKGDPDNKSHRGHPLCQYCDCRYVDRDELFRHLRREHYFCHFCDADGANHFYSDYDSLCEHFRTEHYLCEEGDCVREQLTAVFRTDIDYRAHIANVHGKSLGKLQAKQARTLQLDITIGPRGRSAQQEQTIASLRSRGIDDMNDIEPMGASAMYTHHPPKVIDAHNEQEFPSLGGSNSTASALTLIRPTMSIRAKTYGPAGLARTKENFPALDSGGGGGNGSFETANNSKYPQQPVSAILKNNANQHKGASPGSMVIHVSNRPLSANASFSGGVKKAPYQQDFPALPGTSKHSSNLREDFIPSNSINLSSVSAKHRYLVDEYVSVANNQANSKITVVQQDANKVQKKAEQPKSVPKLSKSDFPALTLTENAPVSEFSWVKNKKEQEAENRKLKVAPAPLSNGFNNNGKKIQEKKEQVKNSKSLSDIDNNNQTKKNKKQAKKENDTKKTDIDTKQVNKQIKEKRIDNNENKTVKSKSNEKSGKSFNVNNSLEFPSINATPVPPPGFEKKMNCSRPPPGFQNVTLNSVAKPKNNLTFTSSSGETYSIVPSHKYLEPPNSSKRNKELVTHFQNALRSPEAVEEFRRISQKFREGNYKALAYYEHCEAALKDKFDEIFPELLSLLPDINKQQELYLVYSQHIKGIGNSKKIPKNRMEVCSICKQVLKDSDAGAHAKSHAMESNFPVLQEVNSLLSSATRK